VRVLSSILAVLACGVTTADAAPVRRDHLSVELVAARDAVAPGTRALVGLKLTHDPEWHTYWVNPGDSGLATKLHWTLPDGVAAGEILWPAPHRLPLGPLTNFGYAGEIVLPFELAVDASVAPGSALPLRVRASWLVCKEECIPGDATLELELPVREAPGEAIAAHAALFDAAIAAQPRVDPSWVATYALEVDDVVVTLAGPVALDAASLELFPVAQQVLANGRGDVVVTGAGRATIRTPRSDAFVAMPAVLELVVVQGDGGAREAVFVEARASGDVGAIGASAPPTVTPAASGPSGGVAGGITVGGAEAPIASSTAASNLAIAIAFAFLGGLLLNLMPCVFPVLALKAVSLATSAHDRARARREGLAYLAGVLATFLVLAAALIALRAGGAALGWGFQLQSPPVVATLAFVMVATGLSMSGVFAIGGTWAGAGDTLTRAGGARGAFFTGVLAVVVASPCTAPFMAPALGYAATASAPTALAVFAALALGLALPLALVSFVPALARVLPRPGAWMETLKQALAFPMYLAALWLFWVLGRQVGVDAMAQALAGAVALGFALWLAGREPASATGHVLRAVAVTASIAAAVFALATLDGSAPRNAAQASNGMHEPYSDARLAALRAEGRPVFVNMTAAWCITCLANERVALASHAVRNAFARHDVVWLEGDWTRFDASITAYLAAFGRNGVPLYVVYPRGEGEPRVLPQVLTPGLVAEALEHAARGAPANLARHPP